MAKKNVEVNAVTIVESKETLWGIAERRASLLVQVLDKLGEYDKAEDAHDILEFCRAGFTAAHREHVALDDPAVG